MARGFKSFFRVYFAIYFSSFCAVLPMGKITNFKSIRPCKEGNMKNNLKLVIELVSIIAVVGIGTIFIILNPKPEFIVALIIITVLASGAFSIIVLRYISQPIVTVTDTLKNISQDEGDLIHAILEKENDETTLFSAPCSLLALGYAIHVIHSSL
jgi:methyl-accepting chemotaxis protein